MLLCRPKLYKTENTFCCRWIESSFIRMNTINVCKLLSHIFVRVISFVLLERWNRTNEVRRVYRGCWAGNVMEWMYDTSISMEVPTLHHSIHADLQDIYTIPNLYNSIYRTLSLPRQLQSDHSLEFRYSFIHYLDHSTSPHTSCTRLVILYRIHVTLRQLRVK